jgi:hypothetical protein
MPNSLAPQIHRVTRADARLEAAKRTGAQSLGPIALLTYSQLRVHD